MNSITLNVKLSLNEYVKASYYIYYKQPSAIIVTLISILFTIGIVKALIEGTSVETIAIVFALVGIIIPFFMYFSLKKNYHKVRIDELMTYVVDNENIHIKGMTFDTTFTWNKICKVSETRNWVLIWQTKYTANVIPKKYLTTDDLSLLNTIVDGHKEVKNKMKKLPL